MIKTFALTTLIAVSLFGQSNIDNIVSGYYGGALFKGNTERMTITNMIDYPGFFKDTLSQCGLAFTEHPIINYASQIANPEGYYFDMAIPYIRKNYYGPSISDLSGYSEFKTSPGKMGVLLSDLYGIDNKTAGNTQFNGSHDAASGKGAVWLIPKKQSILKGISLTINGQLNDTVSQKIAKYSSDTSIETHGFESNYIEATVTSLFLISPKEFLKISLLENHAVFENNSNYSNRNASTNNSTLNNWKFESSSFLLSCGIIKPNGNQANIGLAVRKNNSDNTTIQYSDNFGMRNCSGNATLFMSYCAGKTLHYLQNVLYFGLRVNLADTFFVHSDFQINSYGILKRIRSKNQAVSGCLNFPVIADINLFKSNHFAVLRIEPIISGAYTKKEPGIKNRNLGISLNYLSLGFKGKFTDRLEYFIVPSIQSTIFFTGLELRYRFG
jgi:hypothetical protein